MLKIRTSLLLAVLFLSPMLIGSLLLAPARATPDIYYPSAYNLLGSTAYVSGSLNDVQSDNGVYMTYRSYPTAFSTTANTPAFVGYRSNTGTSLLSSPKARGWNGATWDASETELPTAGSPVRFVRVAYSTLPQYYDYKIVVALSDDGTLDAYVYNGTAWRVTNNLADLWTTAPTGSQRPYDIAFETSSGNALLVYGWFDDTTNDLAYRRWFAGNQSWSGQVLINDPTEATEVDYSFVLLDNDKVSGSNYIGLVALVTTSSDSLTGVWNGSSWVSLVDLSTSVSITSEEDIGVAWAFDGSLMAVSGEGANEVVRWRQYTKSVGWGTSATFDMDTLQVYITNWMTIKADPATDDLMLTMIDSGSDLHTGYWNGATWSITSNIDTTVDSNARRPADFEWEPSGSRGLLVRGTTAGVITWRTWTSGVGWSADSSPVMGTGTHLWVQLRRNPRNVPGDVKILGGVSESTANDLGVIKWDGTTFTVIGASTLSADTTVTTYECFDLEFQNFGDPTSLTSEVEFTGSSNTQSWTKLAWTTNAAWTVAAVNTTVQLYNYQLGQYSTGGDGYSSYLSSVIANFDQTRNQTITSGPTSFRDAAGNWRLKITGVKAASARFNLKTDLVSFETSAADITPPVWSDAGTNNTIAGQPTRFYVRWTDNIGLNGFIFGTNNTGTWSNDTWVSMSGTVSWSNVTRALNNEGGKVVLWRIWANDTSNNWADTGIRSLTTKQLPVASFFSSPSTPYTSDTVTFNASSSYDPDGIISNYFWAFGDGTNATGMVATHSFVENGVYAVTLRVTDNDGLTSTSTQSVTVLNRAPVASFTQSATTASTGTTIYFNGTASYDPDGFVASYFWTFGDGANATGAVVNHAYADNGIYTATLKVTDNDGAVAISTSTITITNRAPTASFTMDAATVYTGVQVNFTASNSNDPDGWITGYYWTFGDGTNATGITASHAYVDHGLYTVTLTVTDNDYATASTSSTITVLNRLPVASFTESASTVYKGEIIYFNASASTDPDGTIASYFWTFGDGTNGTGIAVSHPYANVGTYTVTLTVTDNDGATASKTAIKTVLSRPPVANFTESATTVYTSDVIAFNASASYDPDGTIVTYSWNFSDGASALGVFANHAYLDNGVFTVTLTVTDNDGATGTAQTTVTVLNRPPAASFTESASTVLTGQTIYFNASASHDPDGSIVSYFWTFGDGANGTGVQVNHAYADNGVYAVTLVVTDNDGATASTSATKTVLNRPPIANFSKSSQTVYTAQTVTFNASASNDLDGWITSYFWSFGDGANATGVVTSHAYSVRGIYTVTLTVTDNDGATATTTSTITVVNQPPVASFTESATTVYKGEVIFFNASASYDPDGTIVSYFWTFGDDTNASGVSASHSYANVGTYTVTLTVTDNDDAIASQTAVKTVLSRQPVVSFTQSATTVNTSTTVLFDASASYDPDGIIVNYFWTFGDGTNATGVTASHAYNNNGIYTVTITVTDSDGTQGTTTSTVTVLDRPPVASFTESATTALTGNTIDFNASTCYDPDGFIVNYFWTFGDGANATGVTANHAYSNNGVYTVTLKVTDDDGSTATSSVAVTITDRPPIASFTQSTAVAFKGEIVHFNASSSYDPDGIIVNYFWTFGDGTNATGMIVDHAYANVGTYSATLTVKDDDNSTATTTSSITIQNKPPVAQFTQSATTVYTSIAINFNATSSYDPDGSIVNYFWAFGDGTNASGIIISHSYVDNGVYTVALTVTDNDGATNTKTANTTVLNRPPVASFTTSATTVLTNQTVAFNASASSDTDGTIVSYSWTFGDGASGTGITANHAYADNGVYTVTLTVTDNDGATSAATATITALNRPPVASFTKSATSLLTKQGVTFNASASSDPDGTIVSYSWDFGDGNTTTVTVPVITHSYADNGTYTITLTVTDNDAATNSSSTTITVVNRAPIAAFNQSATTIYTNQAVTFNASASSDLDGSITAYTWNFGDGNTTIVTTPIITHVYQTKGTLTVTLTVTDNDGATNSSTSAVTVLNRPPVASFTRSAATVLTGELVYFNASTSSDPDGTITSYFWTFGDGSNATGVTVSHAYSDNSIYTVTLTVTDNNGATGTTSATETVQNRPPVASFTRSASTAYTGVLIQFNASASSDPDGSIASYFWTFGDGMNATGIVVSHAYADNGVYTVALRVTDNDGATATTTAAETILNRAPTASFNESASTVLTGETIFFNASSSSDPDGSIVNYFWTFGDGSNASGITVSHSYADNGVYTVTLRVTDNDGATATATATKTVLNRPPVAIFTESAEFVYVGETINFNASQSYDSDGTITGYFWTFGDGATGAGVIVSHAYSIKGVFTVTLTVTDNDGATASASAVKSVGNKPPVASFTKSADTVLTSQIVYFDASTSSDPDGTIVGYLWDFGDGTNATGITSNHSYSENAVYTVRLTVTDNDGAKSSTTSTVTVLNRPPVASFSRSASTVLTSQTVSFNASLSSDPDGTIVAYSWAFGDGATATGRTTSHAYVDNGVYTVTLTVTDNDNATSSTTSTVTVLNRPPVASFNQSATTVLTQVAVQFNASASSDPDGTVVSYFWTFGDGTNASGVIASHSYADNGLYTVTLTVTDNDGAKTTSSSTVTVLNRPPVASFTRSATTVSTGELVFFNASASYDLDGTITNYFWTFGDGSNATGVIVSHAYAENAIYTVTLTVTDNDGATGTVSAIETVLNRSPVASFTKSASTVYTGVSVQFNGSASSDADGSIINYFWTFGDGANATGAVVSHAYADNGVYTVTLRVTDNDGATATTTSTVTILNRAPLASFTESASTVLTGQAIYFNASGSSDPDGVIVSYSWTFGDGASASGITASHAYADNGVYTVTLTVTDNDGATATATATKTVLNRPPVAIFTESAEFVYVGETINFNASQSYDPDGFIASYFWTFGDGSNATGIFVTHAYASKGSFTVTLRVTDNDGATATASAVKTVGNKAPVASFAQSASTLLTNQIVYFDASQSYDPDGFITSYLWEFGDGTNATGVTSSHSYLENAVYTVKLTLTDNDGAKSSTTSPVTVLNRPPTASFTKSAATVLTAEIIRFNASASSDPDGVIVSYSWTFGDGATATGMTPTHSYADNGIYNVTLTVTDNDGATASSTTTVTVLNRPPVASFTQSATTVLTQVTIQFNASASSDQDGTIVNYSWAFGDGTNAAGAFVSHSYVDNGLYTVTLTVTDNDAATSTASSTITVLNRPPVASFTPSATQVLSGQVITFDATSSYDPDGFILNFFWTFGDGANATGDIVQHSYATQGVYNVLLTVTDNDWATATASTVINVQNQLPTASYTYSPSFPIAGQTVTFNASNSSDPDGSIISYLWNFGDGNITAVAVSVITHVYPVVGNYTVTLEVTDNDGSTASNVQTVRVRDYPIAVFSYSPSSPIVGQTVTLNASSSTPRGGSITSYLWDFGDGTPQFNTPNPVTSHVYATFGNYTVTLTVLDSESLSATASTAVRIRDYPSADFTFSPGYPIEREAATFDASSSAANGGTITSYRWDFGDGNITTVATSTIVHVYSSIGSYTATLTVTDSEGLTSTLSKTVNVRGYPVALFTFAPSAPYVGDTVIFSASLSTPNGGTITRYQWNFGDATPLFNTTNPTTTHVYGNLGNFTVTLSVTDSEGLNSSVAHFVVVARAPVAAFSSSPTYPRVGERVTFNASASYDPNGYVVSYRWNFGDGNVTTTSTPIITHVYTSTGTYSVALTVTDNSGYTDTVFGTVILGTPKAAFTYKPNYPIVYQAITFNASGSFDPNGYIVSYIWNFGDNNVTTVTGPIITHTYTVNANYTVTLTVSDNDGITDIISKVVPVGKAPVASFTWTPIPAYVGDFVTFNGSSSTPSSGSVTNYIWNYGDGSPTENKTVPTTTHRYISAGNYAASLTIKDSVGLTNTVTRIVTISQAPIAAFTHTPIYPQAYDRITFNASGSFDPNGYIVTYVWDFGDGNITTMTTPIVTHVYPVAGNYSVVLIVTDNQGFAGSAFESLFVSMRPPVADFSFTPSSPTESQTVSFNAANSHDLDGTIVSYTWNFGDGNTTTVATSLITHTYSPYGNYTVTLTVTDNQGLTNAKIVTLIIRGYPTADFAFSPNIASVNSVVTFNASASAPRGGIITSYLWNFGDGSPQLNTTNAVATHTFTTTGQRTVTLRVADSEGLTNTMSKTITIALGPVVSFTYSPTSPYLGDTVTFDASATYDPDGTVVSYRWDFGDGSPLVNLTSSITNHVYTTASNYLVTLTAIDNQGISATTTRSVSVAKAPVAAFTYTPASPIAGDIIRFDASGSSGPSRIITSYRWDFGDGNITTIASAIISHVYTVEGNYNVSLRVSDTGGYSDTASHVVNVRNYPVSSFVYSPSYPIRAQNVTFDASGSQPRGGTIVYYLWNFGDGISLLNTTAPAATHVYTTVGQYTVTLQVKDSEGLTSTTTTTLRVRDYPTATFTYSPASPVATYPITFNASLSLAGSGNITGYTWNFRDGSVITVTTPVVIHVFPTANNYNVTLTVTNTEGLSSTTSRTLTVLNALPIASFTYSPSFAIVNQTVTYNASASHDRDGQIVSYRWSFGDGNITTVSTAIIHHAYTTSGNFTVTLTVTDNIGQTASQTKTVKVGQPPTASFTISPGAPYVGDSVTFDASQSRDPNGNIVTYSWSFGDGPVVNVTNPVFTHTYSTGGNYTVVLTVVDNEGLVSTTSKLVAVAKAPVAVLTFSPGYPVAGEIVTFNASQSYDAKRPIVKYMWTFGGGVRANTTIPVVTYYYPNEGNYTVTLTVFDNAGYSDSITHPIRIRNYPIASFTVSPSSPLKSQPVGFDASSSLPRGGTITGYLWNFGDGTPAVQTSTSTVTHTYAIYGNFTVTLTVSDTESLSGSSVKSLIVREYPTASFTISFPIQRRVPATFNATASTPNGGTITSYRWDFGDGNVTTISYPVIKHAYTSTGIFTVRLTVTDSEALSNTASKSATVLPAPPTASFAYSPLMPMAGQAVTFNASASYDPDGLIVSYNWNFGDGGSAITSAPITSHTYAAVGFYNVTLTVTDSDNYSGTAKKTVEILAYPTASFVWSPLNPLVSTSALFNASGSTAGSGSISSYAWNFGDGNLTTVSAPTILHAYETYGSYIVTLIVTNSKGLSSSLVRSLTVYQTPVADFSWQPIIPKVGNTVTFNASGSLARGGIITTYRWEFNDGTAPVVVYRSTVTHDFASFGQHAVTLTVTDSEGLTNSKSKTILITAPPTASFSWSPYPKAYEAVTFDGSSSSANGGVIVNYRWDFGDGNIANSINPTIVHTYVVSGSYNVNLTATDDEGLSDTIVRIVNVAAAVPPTASFVFLPSSPYVFQVVDFDASASLPGTGTTLNYQWNFGDGNTTSTTMPTMTHIYKTTGNFTLTLTVRNIAGLSDIASKPVTVLPISGPRADFSWSPSVPLANKTATFDGASSLAGWNGSIRPPIIAWRWNFGDGNTTQVNTATIIHVFASPSDYSVTLTVIDINGLTDSETKTVKVSNLIGDLNGDGKVDIKDLAIAAKAYGSSPGMPNWNPIADMNGDLKVDIKDLAIIAKHYGETSLMSSFLPLIQRASFAMPELAIVAMYVFVAFFLLTQENPKKKRGLAFFRIDFNIRSMYLRH